MSEISAVQLAVAPIDKAEATGVLTQYLVGVTQKAFNIVKSSDEDISAQITLANQIVQLIEIETKETEFTSM